MNQLRIVMVIGLVMTACTQLPNPVPMTQLGEQQLSIAPIQIHTQAATDVPSGAFSLTQLTYDATTMTTTNTRLLTAQFSIQNNTNQSLKNLTLIAYQKTNSLSGTAFSQVTNENGNIVSSTAVAQLRPDHANLNAQMDFQVFSSQEIKDLSTQLGIPSNNALLEYGFVARGCANPACTSFKRSIDANGQGRVTIALRIPIASPSGNTAYRFAMNFFAIDESVTRITQGVNETTAQVKLRLESIPDRTNPAQIVFTKGETDVIPDEIIRSLHIANPRVDSNGGVWLPVAPARFQAFASSTSSIALSWDAVPNASSYEIQRLTGNSSYSNFSPLTSQTGTTYTDSNLTQGTSYSYRIRALFDTNFLAFRDTIWAQNYDTPNQFTGQKQVALEFHIRDIDFVYRRFAIYYAWLYRPTSAGATPKPLHIFHHGLGEYRLNCDDTPSNSCVGKLNQNLAGGTPPELIKNTNFAPEMFILSPQTDQSFDQAKSALFARTALETVRLKYPNQISQISISGLSAGTGFVVSALALNPDLYSAWGIMANRGGPAMTNAQYAVAAQKPSWHSANANVNNNGGDSGSQKALLDELLLNGGVIHSNSNPNGKIRAYVYCNISPTVRAYNDSSCTNSGGHNAWGAGYGTNNNLHTPNFWQWLLLAN
jgi:hypothetical protein